MFTNLPPFEAALQKLTKDLARTPSKDLIFPSSFEVALKLKLMLDNEFAPIEDVAKFVSTEPVIATRLISLANSAVYYRYGEVKSVTGAVSRLGLRATKNVAISTALLQYPVGQRSKGFSQEAARVWDHSLYVATAAKYLAAKFTTYDPDEAYFLGMVHDLGVFYFLSRASETPAFIDAPEETLKVAVHWHAALTVLILTLFDIPLDTIAAIKQSDRSRPAADIQITEIADLLFISNLLAAHHQPWEESEDLRAIEIPEIYRDCASDIGLLYDQLKEAYA